MLTKSVLPFEMKILLVEDNPINQKVALKMLAKLGYEADLAVNGKQAVDKVTEQDFDLIFMDLQMPIMDGLTATRNILSLCQETQRNTPHVVALTANVLQADQDRCFESGMVDFLPKPVRISLLEATIDKYRAA